MNKSSTLSLWMIIVWVITAISQAFHLPRHQQSLSTALLHGTPSSAFDTSPWCMIAEYSTDDKEDFESMVHLIDPQDLINSKRNHNDSTFLLSFDLTSPREWLEFCEYEYEEERSCRQQQQLRTQRR